jgi:hypothetical protein
MPPVFLKKQKCGKPCGLPHLFFVPLLFSGYQESGYHHEHQSGVKDNFNQVVSHGYRFHVASSPYGLLLR